eukprot:CAMPEP_0198203012 /NCGR_PEP_ID=MMETSP1445-20131203/6244_1 /TAXON_ID=36898 /ORGANISM="Pyramimonas sp., Strain CCMP2087" /LENGTH=141 /DNA_ID=CAMNT_0043874209 /DNA_START=247 /DNA_END=669 /DNA_ORIENTATION=-
MAMNACPLSLRGALDSVASRRQCLFRERVRPPTKPPNEYIFSPRRAKVVLATSREDMLRSVREKARRAEQEWEPSDGPSWGEKFISPTQSQIMSKVESHSMNEARDWGPSERKRLEKERKRKEIALLERAYHGPGRLETLW